MRTNKGNVFIPILIVAVLVVASIIVYYFYKSQNKISNDIPLKNTASKISTPTSSDTKDATSFTQNIPEYRLKVLEGINKKRLELGEKKLEVDSNLCALAKILAEEKAINYPEDVKQDIFSDPKYKDYIKDFSNVSQLKFTLNDIFIKAAKEKGQEISFTDAYLTEAYTNTKGSVGSPLQTELTNGCVANSPANVGYKPFVFFVGGIKKS